MYIHIILIICIYYKVDTHWNYKPTHRDSVNTGGPPYDPGNLLPSKSAALQLLQRPPEQSKSRARQRERHPEGQGCSVHGMAASGLIKNQ